MATSRAPLSRETYFSKANDCISNSKVGDFLKSKEYYYRKHIEHSLVEEPTAPMKIGRIVDAVVSGDPIPYQVKVLKKNDPDLFEMQKDMPDDSFVTEKQYREALMRSQALTREPFFQEYGKLGTQFQVILQDTWKKTPICGMIDSLTITDSCIYIDDTKSVSSSKVKTPTHWYWNCKEMGYFRQMGAYAYMVANTIDDKKPIICRHAVVSKVNDNLYKVNLYVLPMFDVEAGGHEFLKSVEAIAEEKKWIDPPLSWKDATNMEPPGDDSELIYLDSIDDIV